MAERKFRILIVDDAELNRNILKEMLADEYEIDEAKSGEEAVEKLSGHVHKYDMMLLNMVLPKMDGVDVLAYLQKHHWLEYLPVIVISSGNSEEMIHRAYDYGATDYVRLPFDAKIVRRRVGSTLALYAKQRRMEAMIAQKISENQNTSDMMTAVLSHIVEFRNGESGPHVMNIKTITGILLQELIRQGAYSELREADIPLICSAAALHDIGKISIPDEIINKPGRFTPEEYAVMKRHSAAGEEILRSMPIHQDEPLIRIASDICRWHHERYDGSGYPDGLVGEQIPIWTQVVSLADVYDAMTADRCYRKGYPHEEAMNKILAGECGAFSKELLQCMQNVEGKLREISQHANYDEEIYRSIREGALGARMDEEELQRTSEALYVAEAEHAKVMFLTGQTEDAVFSYREEPAFFAVSKNGAQVFDCREAYVEPANNESFEKFIGIERLNYLVKRSKETTPEEPDFDEVVKLTVRCGKPEEYLLRCRTSWVGAEGDYYGFVGRATQLDWDRI